MKIIKYRKVGWKKKKSPVLPFPREILLTFWGVSFVLLESMGFVLVMKDSYLPKL